MGMNPRLLRPLASGRYGALRVGLVAYWPLEEDASSGDVTAVDWTGRGNDLTSNNTVPSGAGKVGNGRVFDAANTEYLDRASNSDLQFGDGNWSLQLWFFGTRADPGGAVNAFEHVIGKDQSGGREIGLRPGYGVGLNRLGVDIFHTDGTLISVNQPSNTYANFANRWWHCVLTHDSGTVRLWMNGSNVTTSTRAAGKAFAATETPFNVGRRSFSGFLEYFNGTIDEVAKWTRALSASEVATLYNAGNGIDLRR